MELATLKIGDIHPYEHNARKNDHAVDAVAESIRQCEYIAPIIVDENHVILCGHTRLKALKKLGRTEAECVVKAGLTEDQKRKYRLLDNKTAELADWDFDVLADELEGLDFGELKLEWGVSFDEGFGDSFALPSGEREGNSEMKFSLSPAQKADVEAAISDMKHTKEFKQYGETENANSNGNALYLLVMHGWER